jgi:type I restriction enzyme M protein
MLSVGEEHLGELQPEARLEVFGQELNEESYAICRSDLMLKGHDASHIQVGNSFTQDGFKGETFDYTLSNLPFGVDWKKVEDEIRKEAKNLGAAGRFGAGLPRINDGSLLFLQHMVAKMKPVEHGGSRLGIVFNASPLFTGAAGSGESVIRCWLIEDVGRAHECRPGVGRPRDGGYDWRDDALPLGVERGKPEQGKKRHLAALSALHRGPNLVDSLPWENVGQ